MDNVNNLSPSVLAFVGDAVYELYVRKHLSSVNRPSGDLHALSVELVRASAQAKAFKIIENDLSEEELAVFKRGRNFHTSNVPKSATASEYHTATGLECIFGFLYLTDNTARLDFLFSQILENL